MQCQQVMKGSQGDLNIQIGSKKRLQFQYG